jgi:hypothetical protein
MERVGNPILALQARVTPSQTEVEYKFSAVCFYVMVLRCGDGGQERKQHLTSPTMEVLLCTFANLSAAIEVLVTSPCQVIEIFNRVLGLATLPWTFPAKDTTNDNHSDSPFPTPIS